MRSRCALVLVPGLVFCCGLAALSAYGAAIAGELSYALQPILGLLSLVLAPLALAAPAPLPKHARPAATVEQLVPRDLAGDWVMAWGKGEWKVSLSA